MAAGASADLREEALSPRRSCGDSPGCLTTPLDPVRACAAWPGTPEPPRRCASVRAFRSVGLAAPVDPLRGGAAGDASGLALRSGRLATLLGPEVSPPAQRNRPPQAWVSDDHRERRGALRGVRGVSFASHPPLAWPSSGHPARSQALRAPPAGLAAPLLPTSKPSSPGARSCLLRLPGGTLSPAHFSSPHGGEARGPGPRSRERTGGLSDSSLLNTGQ